MKVPPKLGPTYSHTMKPNSTPASPTPIPAISLPPLALPFLVAVADAAVFVPLAADAELAEAMAAWTWPSVGNGLLATTAQPFEVDAGHDGAERLPVKAV